MRLADHVLIEHAKGQEKATITCLKHKERGNFESDLDTWKVKVTGTYHFLDKSLEEPCASEHLIGLSFWNWEWQTFTGILNEFDELEIIWNPDLLTTQDTLNCGLHGDAVKAIIYRGDEKRFHYLLGVSIAKNGDNRMIKGLTKKPTEEML